MKQKTLVTAIKRTLGAEILLSAAFISTAYAQSAPTAASAAAPVAASSAASGKVTKLNKVEVTGSLLKSSDKVGFNQVQVVSAKEIQDSGATTVAGFLRDAAANSGSSFGESSGGEASFAPGGAGIALRGLSEKYTLTLVDGQRVAPYGFAVNGSDNFFDLNTIPLNMVDRIEIVKTGAVSQYGSDAIAGVVNIITKKNFQGVQLDGSYGGGTNNGGNGTTNLGVLFGFGDLNADRFNVTIGASFYKSNGITEADRSLTAQQNYLGTPANQLMTGSAFWEPGGQNTTRVPLSNCPYGGSVINAMTAGGPNSSAPGSICSINTAADNSIQPDEQRGSVKVHATFKISDTTEAWADLWASQNVTTQKLGAWGFNDNYPTAFSTTGSGGLVQIPNIVSGSNPYNPYGIDVPLSYTFANNPQEVKTVAGFYRASTGIKGSQDLGSTLGTWDWTASAGHSQSVVDNTQDVMNVAALQNILGPNGQFNFSNPGATPNGLAGLFTNDSYQGISKLDTVDLTASNSSLFSLPAGDVGVGFGAHFDHESQTITSMPSVVSGINAPDSYQTVNGQRNVAAAYYQIDVPIVHGLTFSQSSRYDHYSDFGGAFSPRFALRWQPVSMLTTYASYDRGFRAPTLVENSQSKLYEIGFATDPYNPVTTGYQQIPEIASGNPNLQPERTKNFNIGFELSPDSNTDFGLDWYKIIIDNVITQLPVQPLITANNPAIVNRYANGYINYVNVPFGNIGAIATDGLEATFRKSLPTSYGTFTLSGDWAYMLSFKDNGTQYAGSDLADGLPFGYSMPRWKGNTTLAWDYRKFNTTLTWEYTGPYAEALAVNSNTGALLQPNGQASYSQFNLLTTYSGIKHWVIYAGINNIMNKTPPLNANQISSAGQGVPYDFSQFTDVGRFVQVGASYRF